MGTARRSQRGFTLIELLVMISILGVLAAVTVIAVEGFSGQADSAACSAAWRNIADAEEVHHAETGSYVDEAGLVAAGRLRSLSENNDVVLTADGYEIVPVGSCTSDAEAASATSTTMAPDDALAAKAAEAAAAELDAAKDDAATVNGFGDGWISLGSAELSDGVAVLTPGKEAAAGAAFFEQPFTTDGLHVSFVAWSGKGGEGLTLALIDPEAGPKSMGKGGSGLGFAGLPGYAVTIDTVRSTKQEPSEPFVGIAEGSSGLDYVSTADAGDLRESWHEVTVDVHGSVLVVAVDGTTILKEEVKLPPKVLVGFTGSTSDDSPDRQVVAKVQISS